MSMKRTAGLVLATAALLSSGYQGSVPDVRGKRPPNGNSKRKHKQNVKRKRVRSISERSRRLNRAA